MENTAEKPSGNKATIVKNTAQLSEIPRHTSYTLHDSTSNHHSASGEHHYNLAYHPYCIDNIARGGTITGKYGEHCGEHYGEHCGETKRQQGHYR